MLDRLATLLEPSAELAEACLARISNTNDDEDRDARFEEAKSELAATMPRQDEAWNTLQHFWPVAIAVFSTDAKARHAARPLRDWAIAISEHRPAGHWLGLMLTVLDNEPVLVIDPQLSLGLTGRISGIVDNFQLNMLLMDVFPQKGFFKRRRLPQRMARRAAQVRSKPTMSSRARGTCTISARSDQISLCQAGASKRPNSGSGTKAIPRISPCSRDAA